MTDPCIVFHSLHTTFVYLCRTMVLYGVKLYYTSNFHSTVHLNRVLHVCLLVTRNIQYCSTWNFYNVSSNSKLSSPINLVSFHPFMATYKFRETYFWGNLRTIRSFGIKLVFGKIFFTQRRSYIVVLFYSWCFSRSYRNLNIWSRRLWKMILLTWLKFVTIFKSPIPLHSAVIKETKYYW